MLLFLIGESLGMQELILIGVIALIIFGPRKLPQIARTIGKTMAEFRKATNEFRSTWEKEVDFENLEADDKSPVSNSIAQTKPSVVLPEIKTLEDSDFGKMAIKSQPAQDTPVQTESDAQDAVETRNSKRDWL